ncbi:glycoside hydrolase family 65 protein [Microbacterium sp. NPDC058345]|uniref:glycoside hydrolase family 65 protein n=1 Tax=Microbacterium sp. NPDC058345 TaxID=3346455 RepID=UPI00365BA182
MDPHRSFDLAPWSVGWSAWTDEAQARRESVFALSNGHLGWRGTLDEGDPCAVPGTYLNGVFEVHPMPYAEDGYGYPDSGQSVINVPDGSIIRLLVDDEPFDIRTGRLERHEQILDFRTGTLRREVEWTAPSGRSLHLVSERLVSLTHRAVAAVQYEVTALGGPIAVTALSDIVANEPLPEVHPDERVQGPLRHPLEAVDRFATDRGATLLHRTKGSGIGVAVSMTHDLGDGDATVVVETSEDLARTTIGAHLAKGESLRFTKIVGHEWSASLTDAALRDRVEAAVAAGGELGWNGLLAEQEAYLTAFWSIADVRIEGAPRLQQAARFALFQVLQSAARLEGRSIPGKGLTGPGYQGHIFWDADSFVVPVLSHVAPDAAREALRWRHATLDDARARAEHLHLGGAAFAWRTIDGKEASGYWPASTAAFHINADVAAALVAHVRVTGDTHLEREIGVELLVETARLWMALGRWDLDGGFHIDGVTGPDEYTAIVDDNAFTNLMAQQNLRGAADAARRHPDRARAFAVDDAEVESWQGAADAVVIPFDARRGVHQQSAGFTEHARWDFEGTEPGQYPLQAHFPYFDLYRKQVVKQADLVLALQFAHECFTPEQTARAFAYYEQLTVRDSSLSASAQAVIAAWVGHLDLAMDYLTEAATIDLDDLRDDIDDGLHIAALGGVWTALIRGFGGMREDADGLSFTPRLAAPMTGLAFGIRVDGDILRVEVSADATLYSLEGEVPLTIRHFGREVVLQPGDPVRLTTPPLADPGPAPTQPRGRAPREILRSGPVE